MFEGLYRRFKAKNIRNDLLYKADLKKLKVNRISRKISDALAGMII